MKLRGRHWCDDPIVGDILTRHNLDVSIAAWNMLHLHKSKTVDRIPHIPDEDMRVLRAVDSLIRWSGNEPATETT